MWSYNSSSSSPGTTPPPPPPLSNMDDDESSSMDEAPPPPPPPRLVSSSTSPGSAAAAAVHNNGRPQQQAAATTPAGASKPQKRKSGSNAGISLAVGGGDDDADGGVGGGGGAAIGGSGGTSNNHGAVIVIKEGELVEQRMPRRESKSVQRQSLGLTKPDRPKSMRRMSNALGAIFGGKSKNETHLQLTEPSYVDRVDLVQLAREMMDPTDGIPRANRTKGDRVFFEAFSGQSVVTWLESHNIICHRSQGLAVGKALFRAGLIAHVQDEHGFEDQVFFYYVFVKDALLFQLRDLITAAPGNNVNNPFSEAVCERSFITMPPPPPMHTAPIMEELSLSLLPLERKGAGGGVGGAVNRRVSTWTGVSEEQGEGEVTPWEHGIKLYLSVEGTKVFFILLFVAATAIAFGDTLTYYEQQPSRELLGWSLLLSRSTAQVINLYAALLLLPVCRNLISYLRNTWVSKVIPLGKNLTFHGFCARMMMLFAAAHVVGHTRNLQILSDEASDTLASDYAIFSPFSSPQPVWMWVLATIPGLTGVLLVLVCFFMLMTSFAFVRHKWFNFFFTTHHLYILFYLLLVIHGSQQLLGKTESWKYVCVPIAIMLGERGIRTYRGYFQPATVVQILEEESGVFRIDFRKDKFRFRPGQYVFLQCPALSTWEWHPFSITSAPDEDHVSLNIKRVGDWTSALPLLLNPNKDACVTIDSAKDSEGRALLRVDGPFGAPSEHVFDYRVVMLMGAGIGATPFASILRNLRAKYHSARTVDGRRESGGVCCSRSSTASVCKCKCSCCNFRIEKVLFYWINRDMYAFEWFADVLVETEEALPADFIEFHTYLTGTPSTANVQIAREDGRDPITGLRNRTVSHRPDIDGIFRDVQLRYPRDEIGVFFCGPRSLSKRLYTATRRHSTLEGTRFRYFKENF